MSLLKNLTDKALKQTTKELGMYGLDIKTL